MKAYDLLRSSRNPEEFFAILTGKELGRIILKRDSRVFIPAKHRLYDFGDYTCGSPASSVRSFLLLDKEKPPAIALKLDLQLTLAGKKKTNFETFFTEIKAIKNTHYFWGVPSAVVFKNNLLLNPDDYPDLAMFVFNDMVNKTNKFPDESFI